MTNLDSVWKSRDITLQTKVPIVKAIVFPVVIYGCESWTLKKAEHQRIDAFELRCLRRLLRVPWTARRSNQSILKEISPGCSLEGLMLKIQYFGHRMQRADSLEKTLMLGKDVNSLLQGIFLTQGWNPGLWHCRRILLPSESPGKPTISARPPSKVPMLLSHLSLLPNLPDLPDETRHLLLSAYSMRWRPPIPCLACKPSDCWNQAAQTSLSPIGLHFKSSDWWQNR